MQINKMQIIRKRVKTAVLISIIGCLILIYYFSLPKPLFDVDYSNILYDRNNEALSCKIAKDCQWRFLPSDSIPYKFKQCMLYYEDEYFNYHPGFNPISIIRAIYQNLKTGKTVSGASTITMQVVRLSRKRDRNIFNKVLELILATRLELSYSKDEILQLYAGNAPFGGNIVGLEAASWRYYGRSPSLLSWGECALLAVLPNKPGLIYPGKNHSLLIQKRNRLLEKLCKNGVIDSLTANLAMSEEIPGKPDKMPDIATHLLNRSIKENYNDYKHYSTINKDLQVRVEGILNYHSEILKGNKINNAALLILDTKTGEALAYVGNSKKSRNEYFNGTGEDVDVITAARSTGSILKPILYSAMLDEGVILPKTLLRDVPTFISGFNPANFLNDYDGAVFADEALWRSLNIPAVWNLEKYGVEKFHYILRKAGLTTIKKNPSHYGLSLILGGAEAKLWELAGVYSSMGRVLLTYDKQNNKFKYCDTDIHPPIYLKKHKSNLDKLSNSERHSNHPVLFSVSSIWFTFLALLESYRPDDESSWDIYQSSEKIAWKTGTSYGFRDAWAVGVSPRYTVAVWAGNASGEGRPGLTGLKTAAPIMFDVFDILPDGDYFKEPKSEIKEIRVCYYSRMRTGRFCNKTRLEKVPKSGLKSDVCTYCRQVILDKKREYRVHSECEERENLIVENRFVLPPIMEWYFKQKNPSYKPLPPVRPDCKGKENIKNMQIIYPQVNARIYIPKELDGSKGRVVFKATHRNPNEEIFWHIDNVYVGSTKSYHQLAINPPTGHRKLTIMDGEGEIIEIEFEILDKKD